MWIHKEDFCSKTDAKEWSKGSTDVVLLAALVGDPICRRYPEIARSSGMEGRVTAKVLGGTNGSIVKIGGMSGPSVFHNEVRSKISNLQFTPALQNGKTVNCWVSVPFSFKLS